MKEEFRQILVNASGLAALMPSSRIGTNKRPQGLPLPAVVVWVISRREGLLLNGRDRLIYGRIQVQCWGSTPEQAEDVAEAVREATHSYSGGGFQVIEELNSSDIAEGGTNEADRPFGVRIDFEVQWSKAQ